MIIQLFGTKKCPETRKAERFFKDRNIDYQFRDLMDKPPSRGELEAILRQVGVAALIDTAGKQYRNGGWAYREFDPLETLLAEPGLYRTPIIRGNQGAMSGFDEKQLKVFLSAEK
ncbi:MAG: hypothetical protein A2087_01420 [Spirochaetes bacterium GWD1_61_31]|nr:MAG: hypothetical protein A2Y37_04340 [Spirochaetes bacterium GWB1_60_80]OHD33489.1 MAG: hypothetical protein A2004_04095 [Spirochaetes bacterium GWC1_61_12]OHD36898.1 MAG: hypothetical protein A2087_01420 [Spirochaetes bacterium GWD1_61_31]OHD42636.1 MAG: hypothetical protein A2Y35_07680 [Spirochaetes bacterium GWE1_60_18]OHD58018.1 MAG: hypothetical protein A2Y32_14385 [Spirochaetes bacterium GWF1_60_12]HAP42609.1 hypothetical protein [Spirochaetaceae bacterium]